MTGTTGAKRATARQTVEVWQYLTAHFDKEKKAYIEGWSDQVIADRVKCSVKSVHKIRSENFGSIDRAYGKKLELEDRVEKLEAAVKALEELWTKPNGVVNDVS